jgi:hypothetical protein
VKRAGSVDHDREVGNIEPRKARYIAGIGTALIGALGVV